MNQTKHFSKTWIHRAAAVFITALVLPCAHAHGDKHEHGVLHLDIATDHQALVIQLESPLDSVLGFEHLPRTDAERQAVEQMLGKLRQGAQLFQPASTAGCHFDDVQLASVLLEAKASADAQRAAQASTEHQHMDMDASYRFTCATPATLTSMTQTLFDAFPRLQRIEVQTVGAKGQGKQTLRRPDTTIGLAG